MHARTHAHAHVCIQANTQALTLRGQWLLDRAWRVRATAIESLRARSYLTLCALQAAKKAKADTPAPAAAAAPTPAPAAAATPVPAAAAAAVAKAPAAKKDGE